MLLRRAVWNGLLSVEQFVDNQEWLSVLTTAGSTAALL